MEEEEWDIGEGREQGLQATEQGTLTVCGMKDRAQGKAGKGCGQANFVWFASLPRALLVEHVYYCERSEWVIWDVVVLCQDRPLLLLGEGGEAAWIQNPNLPTAAQGTGLSILWVLWYWLNEGQNVSFTYLFLVTLMLEHSIMRQMVYVRCHQTMSFGPNPACHLFL